jgi:tRNA pseudouridine13 synthase
MRDRSAGEASVRPGRPIAYKIKVTPEDFRVTEIADLTPSERGRYRLYRLTKAGWNTTDLLRRLARRFGLPYDAFSYGGRKDRHALTTQYITIRDERDLSLTEPAFSLQALGWTEEPMTPEFIRGNEFQITLRAMRAEEIVHLERNLRAVRAYGLPNYFDDQRFGSYDRKRGFIAERLIKDHWEDALRIYLTLCYPEETREARERKRYFLEHWRDWDACANRAKTVTERRIFRFLQRREGDYVGAVNLIPREELAMILSAYQSFLWNEMVREIVRTWACPILEVRGVVTRYAFYQTLSDAALDYLRGMRLPTPGPRAPLTDPYVEHVYRAVLERAGIASDRAFAVKKLRRAYIKAVPREVLLFPDELELLDVAPDERYPGRVKAVLRFILPRGAYGTMVLKRLTLRPDEA